MTDPRRINLTVCNSLTRQVDLWLEPYCSGADVPPNHKIDVPVVACNSSNPDDLYAELSETADGRLILTFYADDEWALAKEEIQARPK